MNKSREKRRVNKWWRYARRCDKLGFDFTMHVARRWEKLDDIEYYGRSRNI